MSVIVNLVHMLEIEGIRKIEKIKWKDLSPGMIFVGGVRINDVIPFELRDYPAITPSLYEELTDKYRFLAEKDIIVARAVTGYSPGKLSRTLRETQEKTERINRFRMDFLKEKRQIFGKHGLPPDIDIPLLETGYIEEEFLILDVFNSFRTPFSIPASGKIPSFFHNLPLAITMGHILTGKLTPLFNLPGDEEVLLHLVVDYSHSMERKGKFSIVVSSLNYFYSYLKSFLKNTEIRLYGFSDECRPIHYPVSGRELPGKETNYSSFIKKVLHLKDTGRRNKVILFTDGEPSDERDALRYGELFRKNNIDYTQIIFNIRDEARSVVEYRGELKDAVDGVIEEDKVPQDADIRDLSDGELEERIRLIADRFTRFARTAGGNQIIVKIDDIAHIIAVEVYDRYLGLLTLADPRYGARRESEEMKETERKGPAHQNRKEGGRTVKKWTPTHIRRGPGPRQHEGDR